MGKRKEEKEKIELPAWSKEEEVPWHQKEEVPWYKEVQPVVERQQLPWYMEEAKQNVQPLPEPSVDQRYFRTLIALLDDHGWRNSRIAESVQRWLEHQDHYRFVFAVRPSADDWVDVLQSLGVKEEHAFQVRAAIQNQLAR